MDQTHLEALVNSGEKFIKQHGVKGMRWGVRRKRDGSGVVKVKYRPTYTTAERRSAQAAVKTAKKSGTKALDKDGAELDRLAKLRTPTRRVVNAVLGTKVSNIVSLASLAGIAATSYLSVETRGVSTVEGQNRVMADTATAIAAGTVATSAARTYDMHKIFFTNLRQNPTVRLKTPLSPSEMAKYTAGKAVTKSIVGKKGSAKLTVSTKKSTVSVKDREGRNLGGQTRVNKPPKTKS